MFDENVVENVGSRRGLIDILISIAQIKKPTLEKTAIHISLGEVAPAASYLLWPWGGLAFVLLRLLLILFHKLGGD